jgi:protein-S-isoprenylcysteine O-methyltransferase Ste14
MHLLDQQALGIVIVLLLGMLVVVKQLATGSILEKPAGSFLLRFTNTFNLFFLLVVNPLAAILLLTRNLPAADPTHLAINAGGLLTILEIGSLGLYVFGFFFMAWALISLGHVYQLGGSAPRTVDKMIVVGPYRFVRHPMYIAVLCISLGLAGLIQSSAFFAVFCIYLVLIILLIPVEEEALQRAYGEEYAAYRQKVKKLVPRLY